MVKNSSSSQGSGFFAQTSKNFIRRPNQFTISSLKFPIWRGFFKTHRLTKNEIDRILAQKITHDISHFKTIQTISQSYFNKANLSPNIKLFINHFKELLSDNQIEILYSIVLLSRETEDLQIASSNAITILNYMDFSFSNKDLSRIKARKADLSGCNFINTDLRNSDLREANLVNSYFDNVNLENCNAKKALFGKSKQILRKNEELAIEFSPLGKYFVCLPSATIWDTKSLKKIVKIPVWASNSASFSPCEKYIAFWTVPGEIIIWDIEKNAQYKKLLALGEDYKGLVLYLPSGTMLLAALKKTIQLWSLLSEEVIESKELSGIELITSISICPESSLLMIFWESSVDIYEIGTLKLIRTFSIGQKVICLALSATKIIISDNKEHLYIWDIEKEEKKIIKACIGSVTSISGNLQKGILATSCYNRTVKIWDIGSQKSLWKYRCPDYSQNIKCILSPDGKILAVCFNKIIKFFFVDEVIKAKKVKGRSGSVIDHVSIYGDDKFIVSRDKNKQATVWDTTTNKIIEKYTILNRDWNIWMFKSAISIMPHMEGWHHRLISHLSMSPCKKFTARNFKSARIEIYDEITNNCISTIDCSGSSFLITNKAEYLVCRQSYENNLTIWKVKASSKIATIGLSNLPDINITCSNKFLAIGSRIIIHLYQLSTGKEIEPSKIMTDEIGILAFSNCGKYLATSGIADRRIFLWSVNYFSMT